MNLYRLIALIKKHDLSEAAEGLHDVLMQVVGGLQHEIQTTQWDNGYKLRSMIHDADRLQELDEELAGVANTTNFSFPDPEEN